MRLNNDLLYLSLAAQAFGAEIVPELRSTSAKAVAKVIEYSFAELLRRRHQSPKILERANHDARGLLARGRSLARRYGIEFINEGGDEDVAAFAIFEAHSAENERLTVQLADVARRLGTMSIAASLNDEVSHFIRAAAEWEWRLHVELTQPSSGLSGPSPSVEPLPRDALEAFLSAIHADRVRISDLKRAEGGYGKQTYFLTISQDNLPERALVVRKADHVMAVRFGAFIVEREFHLLSAVVASGFAAPRPLWLGMRVDGIDGDFFVMERLNGHIPGSLLGGAERIPEHFLLDMAELLAKLHGMQIQQFDGYIDRYETPSLRSETIEQCYRRSIEEWRCHVAEVTQTPSPVMEYLFSWLVDNVPQHVGRPVLVHGDFNIHNVLMNDEGHVSGVLDWECAMFGAPEQDFAYIKPHISKHIEWDRFVRHYRNAGGRAIDDKSLVFYQAFSAMRVLNGIQWFTKKLQSGESHEIRLCMAELGFTPQFMGFALNHGDY